MGKFLKIDSIFFALGQSFGYGSYFISKTKNFKKFYFRFYRCSTFQISSLKKLYALVT